MKTNLSYKYTEPIITLPIGVEINGKVFCLVPCVLAEPEEAVPVREDPPRSDAYDNATGRIMDRIYQLEEKLKNK